MRPDEWAFLLRLGLLIFGLFGLAIGAWFVDNRRQHSRDRVALTSLLIMLGLATYSGYSLLFGTATADTGPGPIVWVPVAASVGLLAAYLLWWYGNGRLVLIVCSIAFAISLLIAVHPVLWAALPEPSGQLVVLGFLGASLAAAVTGRHGRSRTGRRLSGRK